MSAWYTRPVFFVADTDRALAFYVDQLGFAESWRHADAGKLLVAQVEREGSEIILSSQWPDKVGRSMVFVSLSDAAFSALRPELEAKGVRVKDGWWGYACLVIDDPDGNQLFFPQPGREGA
ncbi:MAG TPA: glyoxalase superfamily protein [Caulobacterales bacterium]|nr:glyoxalase superfamily protein [Caulobacterales bacterium]